MLAPCQPFTPISWKTHVWSLRAWGFIIVWHAPASLHAVLLVLGPVFSAVGSLSHPYHSIWWIKKYTLSHFTDLPLEQHMNGWFRTATTSLLPLKWNYDQQEFGLHLCAVLPSPSLRLVLITWLLGRKSSFPLGCSWVWMFWGVQTVRFLYHDLVLHFLQVWTSRLQPQVPAAGVLGREARN